MDAEFFRETRRLWRAGMDDVEKLRPLVERSSPRRHCPQNATRLHANTAASKPDDSSRDSARIRNICADIGGRGGSREEFGDRRSTPERTYERRLLPFHVVFCAACHALIALIFLRAVPPPRRPTSVAANAHKMNSSVGNCRF